MVECTNKNLYKKAKKVKKGRRRFFFLLFLVIVFSLYYKLVVLNNVFNILIHKTNSIMSYETNKAIIFYSSNQDYSSVVNVEKDKNDDIVLISLNSLTVNKFTRQIVDKLSKNMSDIIDNGVEIPILAFSGIEAISGYGAEINYKAIEIVSVNCEYDCTFKSVGINQTLHSIYANVTSRVIIEAPLGEKVQEFSSKVLLCESVIIGKVPEIYLNK